MKNRTLEEKPYEGKFPPWHPHISCGGFSGKVKCGLQNFYKSQNRGDVIPSAMLVTPQFLGPLENKIPQANLKSNARGGVEVDRKDFNKGRP